VRNQIEWVPRDLDAAVAEDHPARAIWRLLDQLDLEGFYSSIKAALDRPGRPTTDPQVLLGLWLLAIVEGVGSARKLARLCDEHDAYRWLRGGVPINYHMLADFRVSHQQALNDLLTQVIGCLLAAGSVRLERVAQDGMRVRASAGASSFRRRESLEECLEAARAQVERLARERDHPDPWQTKRAQRARERAARECEARVNQALAYLPQAEAAKERQQRSKATSERAKITEARASTTDPDARVMKMADGGFRPAYNVELATDQSSGVIVGAAVTSEGTDAQQAPPMEEQVAQRTNRHPSAYLMDGGFASREAVTTLEQRGITVYAPVRQPKSKPEEERYQPRYRDTPEVVTWRERMATEEAKAIYKQRGATAEWANAQVSAHGLTRFTVRGIANATSVVLLVAIAHNLLRWTAFLS
jgi:transposase